MRHYSEVARFNQGGVVSKWCPDSWISQGLPVEAEEEEEEEDDGELGPLMDKAIG